jgi:dTDP-4-dehydrorhamnose 3,5-epimerase
MTDISELPANLPHVEPCSLQGMVLITPRRHLDSRGHFSEAYNENVWKALGVDRRFIQDNQSLSTLAGTLRGLHFQIPPFAQAKLVRVLCGAIYDVAVDIRAGSPTYGKFAAAVLSAENGCQLFVPAGLAHGFCTLQPSTEVLYKVDAPYSREHERGLAWNDPAIGIPWPVAANEVNVAERDRRFPLLDDLSVFF